MRPAIGGLVPIDLPLVELASAAGAAAFMDDPYTHYAIPDPKRRPNLKYGFEYYLRMSVMGNGMPYTTSPACEGVIVWQDSSRKDPFWLVLRANPLLPLRCGWRYIIRESATNRLAEKVKKKFVPGRHIYLALLAVQPASQGKGFAGKMIRAMLGEVDKALLPCYLETQNLKNVAIYENFGFKLVHKLVIPGTHLPLYSMLRPAVG